MTFAFFAAQIGRALFPTQGGNSLLFSLATFGVGFLTRPLGGIVIGRLADKRGRKLAMLLTFACMGVAIVGLAFTPSYAMIGMGAPVLAILFRMLQGFALGGEVGPNTAYLLEAAPPGKRGFYVSFQYLSQDMAVLSAGVVGFALSSWLTGPQLDAWGWRVAFLLGAAIIPLGFYLRRTLTETLPAHAPPEPAPGDRRRYWTIAIAGLLVLAAGTIANYTLNYLNTYAQETLGMKVSEAFGSTVALGLAAIMMDLIVGRLSDRYGRKRVMIAPWLLLIVIAVPAFGIIAEYRSPATLLAMTALMSALLAALTLPGLILFTEALPTHLRAGSLAMVYAFSIAIFGGSAQVVVNRLIAWTGNPVAPGWYMTGALIIGLIAVCFIPERRRGEVLR